MIIDYSGYLGPFRLVVVVLLTGGAHQPHHVGPELGQLDLVQWEQLLHSQRRYGHPQPARDLIEAHHAQFVRGCKYFWHLANFERFGDVNFKVFWETFNFN